MNMGNVLKEKKDEKRTWKRRRIGGLKKGGIRNLTQH